MHAELCEQNLQSDASEEDGIGRVGEGKRERGSVRLGGFLCGREKERERAQTGGGEGCVCVCVR